MSRNPNLRRLLSRKRTENWLNHCQKLAPSCSLAVFDGRDRLFAHSLDWDPDASLASVPNEEIQEYVLNVSGAPAGRLLVCGGELGARMAAADLAAFTLNSWLEEALENRGLAEEALDRYREINLLYRVGQTIGATLNAGAILIMLMEESRQIIEADFGFVLLADPQHGWEVACRFPDDGQSGDPQPYLTFVSGKEGSALQSAIITEFSEDFGPDGLEGVGSLLWAPLSVPEKLLGGIFLGRDEDQAVFVANDQNLLVALTTQAAVALEKATLFEETETNARHLQELNQIGRNLATTLSLQPLLERIMDAAIELTSAERGSLLLIDQETQEIVFRVVSDPEDEFLVGSRLPMGAGIVGEVAETGEPAIVNRVKDNESFFAGIDSTTGYETRSILAVPMIKEEEVVGVIEVLNRKDGKPFQEQDTARLASFSSQAVVAMESARLHQEELTKQRMERELQLGHTMQSSLIPSSVPHIEGWQFAAWWQPAREVSGDFYDFIALDEDLGLVIADVADKGVHAALFMSLARSTVRTSLRALREPAISIFEANRLIAEDAPNGMFLTLCYAHFDPGSGEVTYVNAGHNPPLWHRSRQNEVQELPATGIFLGMVSDLPFAEETIECAPGDVLLFFTDGVTEAMNPQRDLYGEERLLATVQAVHEGDPQQILQGIKDSLANFIQGASQSDDITIVVAKRT